jgi:hypothetical protein
MNFWNFFGNYTLLQENLVSYWIGLPSVQNGKLESDFEENARYEVVLLLFLSPFSLSHNQFPGAIAL